MLENDSSVSFFSFSAVNTSFSSVSLVKKHDAYKRLMWTSAPNKKVAGNSWTYIKKKRQSRIKINTKQYKYSSGKLLQFQLAQILAQR